MSSLKNNHSSDARTLIGASCKSKITLAINAGGAATVKSTGAWLIVNDGIFYTFSALAAQSIVPTHDCMGATIGGNNLPAYVQPVSTTVYYLVCANTAGTIAIVQGNYAGQVLAYPDLQRRLTGQGGVPQEPANYVAIGLIKVVTNGATTFTPGTTLLDAAGLTVSYFDLERVPSVAP